MGWDYCEENGIMETAGKHVDRETQAYAKLTGKMKHFCPDWDFMAIDETTPEFEACTCDKQALLQRNFSDLQS